MHDVDKTIPHDITANDAIWQKPHFIITLFHQILSCFIFRVNSQNNTTPIVLLSTEINVSRKRGRRPTLGVSGLLKGEGSAERFSLPNESSLCLCANFFFSASAMRAAGSDEHAMPLLFRLLTGVPPGDLQIQTHVQY